MSGHFIAPLRFLLVLLYSNKYKKVTSWAAKFEKRPEAPDKFIS